MPAGGGGDDLGGSGGLTSRDRTLWGATGAVYGLEEGLRAGAERARAGAGRATADAIWADVRRLGIRIIAAHSPQAEGRVERNHGTHQDRLVKKLRRKQVKTHAEANRYLAEEYCEEHNARYAQAPAAPENYHLPGPGGKRLGEILRLEAERVLSNDWVVQYQSRLFQVERQSQHYAPAKSKVTVCEGEDGRIEIHYRGHKLKWKEIAERPARPTPAAREPRAESAVKLVKWKPAADHPWRQYADRGAEKPPSAGPWVPGTAGAAGGGAAGAGGVVQPLGGTERGRVQNQAGI